MTQAVKAAKDALEQAVTAFKCARSAFNKSVNVDENLINVRSLRLRMKKLDDALADLNSAHTLWVSRADFSDELLSKEKYSTKWLEEQWSDVSDLQDLFDSKTSSSVTDSEPPTQTNTQKLEMYDKEMVSFQLHINDTLKSLSEKSAGTLSTSTQKSFVEILNGVRTDMNVQFKDLLHKILPLDTTGSKERLLKYDEFRRNVLSEITKIDIKLAEASTNSTTSSGAAVPRGVQMEKSRAPTFSGRTIEYPEFKRGWNKVAGQAWEDGNQVEQIKQKVDMNTRRIISRCNTMTEVWEALDLVCARARGDTCSRC